MLHDTRIRTLVDYFDPNDCFPGIDLSGGVCYFLWDRDNNGECKVTQNLNGKSTTIVRPLLEEGEETFIRFNSALSIYSKIKSFEEESFSNLVSPQTPFGFVSSFKDFKDRPFHGCVKLHTVKGSKYISRHQVKKNQEWVNPNKVYISKSYGERGSFPYLFLAKPFVGHENSCCTQTYLMIGPTKSIEESENIRTYIQTKFFRFLIMLKKNTQDAMRKVYAFVPIQDFSEPWTDEKLYKKYGLTEDEIAFIESMVRPMDLGGADDE